MLKKLGKTAVAISALSLTAAAFAGGPNHMAMPIAKAANTGSGLFVGPELGMATTGDKMTLTHNGTSRAYSTTTQLSDNSFLGGALAGFQWVFSNNAYMALAGNALYNSLNTNFINSSATSGSTSTTNSISVKNSFQGGADLRLGYRFDSIVTPYLLGGVEAGNWQISDRATDNSVVENGSMHKTLVGPKAGAGILFSIPQTNWQAGLEYAYSWMGNVTATSPSGKSKVTYDLNQGQIMASASYLFNA